MRGWTAAAPLAQVAQTLWAVAGGAITVIGSLIVAAFNRNRQKSKADEGKSKAETELAGSTKQQTDDQNARELRSDNIALFTKYTEERDKAAAFGAELASVRADNATLQAEKKRLADLAESQAATIRQTEALVSPTAEAERAALLALLKQHEATIGAQGRTIEVQAALISQLNTSMADVGEQVQAAAKGGREAQAVVEELRALYLAAVQDLAALQRRLMVPDQLDERRQRRAGGLDPPGTDPGGAAGS